MLKYVRLPLAFLIGGIVAGCGNGSEKMSEPLIAKGDPGFVRIVNLSGRSATGEIGTAYRNLQVDTGEMTSARPVRSGKPTQVKVTVDGRSEELDVVPDPKGFVTVIVGKDGLDSFNSGEGTSAADFAKVDLVNLTGKAVEFTVQGTEKHQVQPNSSKTVQVGFGSTGVSATGVGQVDIQTGRAMVWAVFAYPDGGKSSLGSKNLKGDGQAVGTGGPS